MIEKACQFGKGLHLEGVLTIADTSKKERPALILLSAGMLHKIGPSRLHPILARELATLGVHTLRFDMQGLGDSDPAPGQGTLQEQTRDSVLAAMDLITRETGVNRFVLGGLCSGAEDSFRIGSEDDRVVGLMLLDAHAYPTLGYKLHRLWYRIRRKPLHVLGWYLKRDASKASTDDEVAQRFGYIEFPEKNVVVKSLKNMAMRGTKMLYIYSGAWDYFSYRRQFYRMFSGVDLGKVATVYHFKHQDHTITLRRDRNKLVDAIERWFYEAIIDRDVS